MPIVFLHGVNNRIEDPSYAKGVAATQGFLRSIVAPALGLTDGCAIDFPYWGDHGVRFRWQQASLPSSAAGVEAFGADGTAKGDADVEAWLAELRIEHGERFSSLAVLSREKGFDLAADLVWDAASRSSDLSPEALGAGYAATLRYVADHPAPLWAIAKPPIANDAFVDKLLAEVFPSVEEVETFSLSSRFAAVKERLSRLASAPADAATSLVLRNARAGLHAHASRFVGDICTYLTSRGSVVAPGPIVRDVAAAIAAADAKRLTPDEPLVVIGHSLGGLVAYDVLTHFRPDLRVDTLVTVGSQVALFEEMTLCSASKEGVPSHPLTMRLTRPASIERWLNVFDTNDIFAFRLEGVFEGVNDFAFDTGYGLLQAHGGYFARPSFYRKLASRLSDGAKP